MDYTHYLESNLKIEWYNHNLTYNYESFLNFYKFPPLKNKINLLQILTKKPLVRTKLYKNFQINNILLQNILTSFNSFEDLVENYSLKISENDIKKIYSSMKILLINKQELKNTDYSVFDNTSGHIYNSKKNLNSARPF